MTILLRILRYIRPYWRIAVFVYFCLISVTLLTLVSPWLIGGAIDAVDFAMDHLKSDAWFWKREKRAGAWHWIEPRAEDHADLARWK